MTRPGPARCSRLNADYKEFKTRSALRGPEAWSASGLNRVLASAQLCQTRRYVGNVAVGTMLLGDRLALLTSLQDEIQGTQDDDHNSHHCYPIQVHSGLISVSKP